MGYFALILGVFGIVFCSFWLRNPDNESDGFYAKFSMFGSILFVVMGVLLVFF